MVSWNEGQAWGEVQETHQNQVRPQGIVHQDDSLLLLDHWIAISAAFLFFLLFFRAAFGGVEASAFSALSCCGGSSVNERRRPHPSFLDPWPSAPSKPTGQSNLSLQLCSLPASGPTLKPRCNHVKTTQRTSKDLKEMPL